MQLYLLGAFLLQNGKKTVRLPRHKVEALLAYLVLHPQAHPREQLAALLWGDTSDANARTSLRTALGVLRKHVHPEIVLTDRTTLQLNPGLDLWVDVRALDRAHREAVVLGQPLSADELRAHCALYRGELLTEFYQDWILPLREHYRAQHLALLLLWVQQLRSASEYARAIQAAQRVLAIDPAQERAFQHLMFCHIALGDRQAALNAYAQCVRALREELDVEPLAETTALAEWIAHAAGAGAAAAARLTNLPIPLSSFVGRQREMATLKEFVARSRIVTLTGAGGSGKTRLAVQAGADLIDAFRDGVWWVEFAAVNDAAQAPSALAKALGVREQPGRTAIEGLVDWLGAREMLLILDNCEHLVGACAELAEKILSACAGVKILATSREPLRLSGEQVWNVPTLAVPDSDTTTLTELLMSYEAVRLFVERARAVKPDFELTERNALSVVKICQRLDGIPLALELAAARVNVLAPEELAARLRERFTLLTDGQRTALPRQQTLRALIDWSFDLLAPQERTLFWRLGVFSGGRTLDAIQAVCAGDGIAAEQVVDLLARLVSKSLLAAGERNSETRYSFLDSIKQYAREKLRASGESDALKDRHLTYYRQLAAQAETELASPQQAQWMRRLELDHYNLRNALEWADASGQSEAAFALAAALWRFWKVHGHYSEGRAWYARLIEKHAAAETTAPRVYAGALYAAGMLAYHQSDFASAARFHENGLRLQRQLNDAAGIARGLSGLGLVLRAQGDYVSAQTHFEEALELARTHGQIELLGSCLRYLGLLAVAQGDAARAVALYEQALPLHEELGDAEALANLYNNLGIALMYLGELERAQELNRASLAMRRQLDDLHGIALSLHTLSYYPRVRGEWADARELLTQALRLYQRIGTKENTIECLESIAYCDLQWEQLERAAQLYGAAEQLRARYRIPRAAPSQKEFENERDQARARLTAFDAVWDNGQRLTLEQAIVLALAQ